MSWDQPISRYIEYIYLTRGKIINKATLKLHFLLRIPNGEVTQFFRDSIFLFKPT